MEKKVRLKAFEKKWRSLYRSGRVVANLILVDSLSFAVNEDGAR